ncbi:molybdenum cofactor biosynthesis protein MoaE [Mycobacterium simiae]|uniref:Molybdenum cofactor biosynthesis protein MoaE n=1 Tax=Mycobacterium simiae TaxID=1784 RepID=A0A5B1BWL9_MYCSI|nr:molybdenum cofactor biosynthesis protein MoaE [Mycobacterium simiae]KAA1251810.1 molybdenum cofactor biosynthesis protein MoaE [Mycobacterium simiae]
MPANIKASGAGAAGDIGQHRPDEVTVGCHDVVVRAGIETAPLDVGRYQHFVDDPAAGALVTFVGAVRDHDRGQRVVALEYSAHPIAEAVLGRLAGDVAHVHRGVRGIAAGHRVGRLDVGEVALCVVVAAEHRRQAFDACGALVEAVKRDLPVWKLQVFTDGERQWVGAP